MSMGSISMALIDAEGKGLKVPKPGSKTAVSFEQDKSDDGTGERSGNSTEELILILLTCVGNIHDHCTALQALLDTELQDGRAALHVLQRRSAP